MKLSVMKRITGFARGYEIPVIVSRSQRGKLWVFQKKNEDKVTFVLKEILFGVYALMWLVLIVYPLLLRFTELGK